MIYKFYELFFYFILYAFAGWLLEVAYALYSHHKFINRGFLFGPYCPLYGVGAVFLVLFMEPFKFSIIISFIIAVLITSGLEYLTGYVLKKCFETTWWDYSDDPFNVNGFICLHFSILWGIGAVIFMRFIHPFIASSYGLINNQIGYIFLTILFILTTVDFLSTLYFLMELNRLFSQLQKIYLEFKSKIENYKELSGENTEKGFSELKSRYELVWGKIQSNYSRLLKAFPNLTTKKLEKIMIDVKTKLSTLKKVK